MTNREKMKISEKLEHIKKVFPKKFEEFDATMMIDEDHMEDTGYEWDRFIQSVDEILVNCNSCGQVRSIYYFDEVIASINWCIDCKTVNIQITPKMATEIIELLYNEMKYFYREGEGNRLKEYYDAYKKICSALGDAPLSIDEMFG